MVRTALLLASRLVGTAALVSSHSARFAAPPRRLARRCAAAMALPASQADSRLCLTRAVARALSKTQGGEYSDEEALVTVATQKKFGDYQCNAALPLAKKLGKKPREIAEELVAALEADAEVGAVFGGGFDIAGPGFVNARLGDAWLGAMCETMVAEASGRVGVPLAEAAETVVVDYSSPNIAKEMHVGHLRSTVIGDALANVLELRGHRVIRQNHVGDWGTQFGMLIQHMEDVGGSTSSSLGDLVEFYKAAKKRFDADAEFKDKARMKVVALQRGDEAELASWRALCAASRVEFGAIYDRLKVAKLEERGESAYNAMLAPVVAELEAKGLAEVSAGALVVFDETDSSKEKNPLIVRKSDGAYNYASTDLAAARYRAGDLGATRVLYVTDAGQASHFRQVFQVARRASLVPETCLLTHVPFGLVQSEDGKKFATRSGDTVRLRDLLDEAQTRALEGILERRAEHTNNADDVDSFSSSSSANHEGDHRLPDNTAGAPDASALAAAIGIGAVKYADLSLNRESNYKFSYDKMLALAGNTAPYMLYSYARIAGIRRKAEALFQPGPVTFVVDEERALARHLAALTPTLVELERDLRPNVLCDHLFELAQAFNRFYENCPVLKAPTPEIGASRATLCAATAASLNLGLSLLGIPVVDRI